MPKGEIAGTTPIAVDVIEGRNYFWCVCGKSAKQPFCDGSHQDTEFEPMKWTADATGKKFFCACKQTQGQPFCDGTHNRL